MSVVRSSVFVLFGVLCGCGAGGPIEAAECEAQGGHVVGDIGDGATHRAGYLCASGSAPIADVNFGIEGGVCCL